MADERENNTHVKQRWYHWIGREWKMVYPRTHSTWKCDRERDCRACVHVSRYKEWRKYGATSPDDATNSRTCLGNAERDTTPAVSILARCIVRLTLGKTGRTFRGYDADDLRAIAMTAAIYTPLTGNPVQETARSRSEHDGATTAASSRRNAMDNQFRSWTCYPHISPDPWNYLEVYNHEHRDKGVLLSRDQQD